MYFAERRKAEVQRHGASRRGDRDMVVGSIP